MAASMKDFEKELESSFKVIKEGDILDVTVIGISETELTVDLNYYTEGIIPLEECSDDPAFSIKNDCNIGDTIRAMVIDAEELSYYLKKLLTIYLYGTNLKMIWQTVLFFPLK